MTDAKILVIDDNTAVLSTLKIVLKSVFKTVVAVSDPQLIPALISAGDVDAVLLDMNFGSDKLDGQDGLFWLDRIMSRSGLDNPPAVVMITAFGDVGLAVTSLKKGALDFIQKPWDNNDLIKKLHEAIAKRDALYAERQKNPAVAETEQQDAPSSLDEMEKLTIQRVLESSGRNLTTAAEKLGISRQTLYNKMKHHGII
ncbi:MAG: response regulator [Bacteroidaceae bacterium]|nr:response regulator [Bacteroidaceae bacterium]MBO7417060.1 response regulator [Bacteroidaceae bacterium]